MMAATISGLTNGRVPTSIGEAFARGVHDDIEGEPDVDPPSGRAAGAARAIDSPVFPVVPCANTKFRMLMTAEKLSDAILAG